MSQMVKKHGTIIEKKLISFDGVEIYYNIRLGADKKRFLILLHGLGGDSTAWSLERDSFYDFGYSTLAVDLRGHGLSGRPEELKSYQLTCFVKDIVAILQMEKIKKPVLIGHCFGGMISLLLEVKYPRLVSGLILIDTSFKPPFYAQIIGKHALLKYMMHILALHSPQKHIEKHANFTPFKNTSDYYWKRILSDISHVSLKSYLLMCESLCSYNSLKLLNSINVPTLIIEGVDDSVFPLPIAQELHHRIKNSTLNYIPEQNHILILNHSKNLTKSIHEFLAKF